jgi:uncharacterized protein YacL
VEDYDIEDQRPDEEIILTRYMHPWVLAKTGFFIIILILIVVIAFLILGSAVFSYIMLAIVLSIIIFFGSTRWFLYKNALFILTNHRVIYVDQRGLFKRKVQEIELENIYNLQYIIDGPIKSFLNFGDIELTTVGSTDSIIKIKNISNPHFVHEKISWARKKVSNKLHPNEKEL